MKHSKQNNLTDAGFHIALQKDIFQRNINYNLGKEHFDMVAAY